MPDMGPDLRRDGNAGDIQNFSIRTLGPPTNWEPVSAISYANASLSPGCSMEIPSFFELWNVALLGAGISLSKAAGTTTYPKMTRESAQAVTNCPNCGNLAAANQNFCGYCGASLNDSNRRRDYECAVGSAILALNSLESDVFYLLDILDVHYVIKEGAKKRRPLPLEGAFFREKIDTLCHIARRQTDPTLQTRLQRIAAEARRLGDERNNFAHGLLWVDGFTGEHRRTFVRRGDSRGIDDPRPPALIEHVAFELIKLSLTVRDLAMELGGLERWEKFCDEYLDPILARREKPAGA